MRGVRLCIVGCLLGSLSNAETYPAVEHLQISTQTAPQEDKLIAIRDLQAKAILKDTVAKEASFESVQNLRLDNAQISTIEGFEVFKNLKHLSLSGNFISNIIPLTKLTPLETLELSKNQIVAPSGINLLERLESLDLSYNNLKYAFCCMFVSLRYLKLNNNKIQQLIFLNNFNSLLEEIDVSNNLIKNITLKTPLPSLKKLNASGTFITQVNDLIHMQMLEELILKNCLHLKSIAPLFERIGNHWQCRLKFLKKLSISEEFLDKESEAILTDIKGQKDSKLVVL